MKKRNEQENFWAGEFGDNYINRSSYENWVPRRIAFFSEILHHFKFAPNSAFEMGCNVGINLKSLQILLPEINLCACEINEKAFTIAKNNTNADIYNCSINEFTIDKKFDLTMSLGVLIHINPNDLKSIYRKLYDFSNKYILISEYYNPIPVQLDYRNNSDKLFKRDFAGEILDLFPQLTLLKYGFIYHRDPIWKDDDTTWFLFEKK